MLITVTDFKVDDETLADGDYTLRFTVAGGEFVDSDGVQRPQGSTQTAPASVVSGLLTAAPFPLAVTTDATVNQRSFYSVTLHRGSRNHEVARFGEGIVVPWTDQAGYTWEELKLFAGAQYPFRDNQVFVKTETIREIDLRLAALTPGNASALVKGLTYLDTNPAVAGVPRAVGTNSILLPTADQRAALAGSAGTPSASNRYLTEEHVLVLSSAVNAKVLGATGDGTTVDTTALNAAIAAFNQSGGVLYLPRGDYSVPGGVLANITANGRIIGDGHTDSNSPSIGTHVTRIKSGSATGVLFTVNSKRLTFEHLDLLNAAASTPTAGAGIKVTNATNAFHQVDYESISVERFYDLLDIEVANNWSAFKSWFRAPVRYGAHIRNLIIPDTGGWAFVKCSFVSSTFAGIGIFAESCGGAHVNLTHILGMAQAVKVTGVTTGILDVMGCNFENLSGIPVELSGWHSVRIIGNEFGLWDAFSAGIESIKLSDLRNAEIVGCVFNAPFGGDRAITLHNCEGVNVAPMSPGGYNRLTAITGTWEPYTSANHGFLALGFVNGWINVPGFQSAQVSLIGGQVVVRMNVQGGTLNSQITSLPLGYRPKASRIFDGGDNAGHCRFIVEANGNVTQYQGTSNLAVSAEFSFWP